MELDESESTLYQSVIEAIDKKEKDRARDLLTRLIKINPEKADYWVWMSSLVPTTKEKTYCLQEALRLEPKSSAARRGLAILGVLTPDDKKIIPFKNQRRNWSSLFPTPGVIDRILLIPAWIQTLSLSILGGSILIIFLVIYFSTPGLGLPGKAKPIGRAIETQTPTTYSPLSPLNPLNPEKTPTFLGPTPFSALLSSTYTPTPFYVNTPHPKLEAYRAAINAFNRQDPDKMRSYLEQSIEIEPKSPDLYYHLGEAYRLKKDYSQAITAYKKALSVDPQFAPAYLGRGRATIAGFPAKWKDAKGDLIKATDLDPYLVDGYLETAEITMDHNLDPVSAVKLIDQAYKRNPRNPQVYIEYAKAYLLLNEPEKAMDEARIAIQLDISQLEAYHLVGEAAFSLNKPSQAVEELIFYTIYRSDDAEALFWLGQAFRETGETEKAVNAFSKSIKADSTLVSSYIQRGQIYLDQNQLRLAHDDFEKAAALDKNSFNANFYLGRTLLAMDEAAAAYSKFNSAEIHADNDEQIAFVYYWRAKSLQKLQVDKPSYKENEARDWLALLNLPPEKVPAEWVLEAQERVQMIKGYIPLQATTVSTPSVIKTSGSESNSSSPDSGIPSTLILTPNP